MRESDDNLLLSDQLGLRGSPMKNIEILNESSHILDDDLSLDIVDDSPLEDSRRNLFCEKGIKDKALNNFQKFK